MKLLYLVHADASFVPLYRAALGPDVDVVAFVAPALPNVAGGGMSSRYAALGVACKSANGGHVVPGLVKRYPPPRPLDSYSGVYLACWSAGYALPRVFSARDVVRTAGLVLLDSGHAARSSLAAGVGWAVEWARLAREGMKVFAIGHSDVHTYADTASTTEFAIEVERQVGGEGGLFVVRAFDVAKSETDEHVAALRGWGPGFVAEALSSHAQPDTDRAPRALEAAPHGFRIAVRELVEDARAAGTWHDASSGYSPKAGDLGIYARGAGDPTKGGTGHVGRLCRPPDADGRYETLDGNAGTAWGLRSRNVADNDLRGWIEYPAALGQACLDWSEVEAATVREEGGANAGPVKKYFAHTTRKIGGVEKPTGWTAGWEWCAAAASEALYVGLGLELEELPSPEALEVAARHLKLSQDLAAGVEGFDAWLAPGVA